MVEKQIHDDQGRQLALMNLGHQFDDAIIAKDELRKAYEECRDISLEQHVLTEDFLKIESELDHQMQNALFKKAAKMEKQSRDKLGFVYSVDEHLAFRHLDSNSNILSLTPVASSEGESLIISGSFHFRDCRVIYACALEVEGASVSSCRLLFTIPHPADNHLKLLGFNKDKEPIVGATIVQQCLSTLHFLKIPKNSFEVLKILKNSMEVLKILENKLESMKILENKLESLKLQENQPVDGVRGSIMHDDLTYPMLHDMLMKKFNLEANYPLNLSAKLSSFEDTFDITDDTEVQFFVECACNSKDELAHLYVSQHKTIDNTASFMDNNTKNMLYNFFEPTTFEDLGPSKVITSGLSLNFGPNDFQQHEPTTFAFGDYNEYENEQNDVNDVLDGNPEPNYHKHPSIALEVHNEFPLAFHAVCCRHLMMNLSLKNNKTKGLFWKICKAYTPEEFSSSMNNLQAIQPDAYHKLCEAGPERWSRAHCPLVRYNYLTSNSVESINACTILYRKLPVLKLAETYRAMVQDWFTSPPERKFIDGIVATVDPVELENFSTNQVKFILTNSLGYDENSSTNLYLKKPNRSLDSGLVPLADSIQDRDILLTYIQTQQNRLHVYVSRVDLSLLVMADHHKDKRNKKGNQGNLLVQKCYLTSN
ncbi:hypothetical protein Tco_0567738 [Tanacetum coccineum]